MSSPLGITYRYRAQKTERGSFHGDLNELLESNQTEINSLVNKIKALKAEHHLDDYGVLRFCWDLINNIGINLGRNRVRFRQALHSKSWDNHSRLAVFTNVMQRLNRQVFLLDEESEAWVVIGVRDPNMFNSNKLKFQLSYGQEKWKISGLLWNGTDQIGDINYTGDATLIFDWQRLNQLQPLQLKVSEFPSCLMRKEVYSTLKLYGDSDKSIAYFHLPYLMRFLAFYPSLQFIEHCRLARLESRHMGLELDLGRLKNEISSEIELVNLLLRTLQARIQYQPGPLKGILNILNSNQGDCDQLSMLMVVFLLEIGFTGEHIIAVEWRSSGAGHLALAVRPIESNPEGVYFEVPNSGRYYALDMTYYLRDSDGQYLSKWGSMSEDLEREATIKRLSRI